MESIRTFIGREFEREYLLRPLNSLGVPSRRLLFLCGPSGIGKTRLVQEVSGYINNSTEHLSLYLSLAKSYMDIDSVLNDMASQLDKFIQSHKLSTRLKSIVDSILRSLEVDLSTPFTSFTLSLRSQGSDALTIFNNLLEKASIAVASAGGGLVFIDELQNFLEQVGKWSPWGLFKYLSSIQEYTSNGYVRFILVSSDFLFRKRVLESISGEYIATFYIGELSKRQSIELLSHYIRGIYWEDRVIEDVIEIVGGSPSNIIVYASLVRETRSYRKALSSIVNPLIDDLYTKLDFIRRVYGGEILSSIRDDVLEKIVEEPLPITELPVDHGKKVMDAIDYLVKQNILQHGNSSYIGIYRWNKDMETSGECGLDVMAPSSRLYLYTICRVLGVETKLCRRLYSLTTSIGD